MARVEIRDLNKAFGAIHVLHGIELEIADGEFVALVGPSGCGKTTLLRMLAGLESVTAGEIAIADRVVNNVAPKDRDIAMVFQNYALYPNMTVEENMSFALRLQREKPAVVAERVQRAAEILGLGSYLQRQPRALSGGQRQRVAMGRAIVRDPQVFLFDEPLSNLDAKLRVKMRTEIKQLHQRLQTTTVYVTHDQVEAMTMADRIVVMRDGRVEQIGRPLDLYNKPANAFVAGFIGSPSMNMLEGVVSPHCAGTIDAAGFNLKLAAAGLSAGQPVTLGVRPEDLVISPDGLEMQIAVVEPTGPETFVTLRTERSEILASFREQRIFDVGERISVALRPGRAHLFSRDTGDRLN